MQSGTHYLATVRIMKGKLPDIADLAGRPERTRTSILLDADLKAFYGSQPGGLGHSINAVLRWYYEEWLKQHGEEQKAGKADKKD